MKGKRILAVDDSVLITSMLSSMFEEEGYDYHTCKNGQEGLDTLKNDSNFDLIITDLNMPVLNGLEMLEEVQKDPTLNNIPIAMLTTEDKPELKDKAKKLGVRVWLKKPFNKEKTLLAIDILLRQKR